MNGRRELGLAIAVGLLSACGTSKPAAIDRSAVAKLSDAQMRPIDDARTSEAHAVDQVASAKQAKTDAANQVAVAKADVDVANAELKKAKADLDAVTAQKADNQTIAMAKAAIDVADLKVKSQERRVTYLKDLADLADLRQDAASAHLTTAQAATEKAKFDSLAAAGSTEVQNKQVDDYEENLARAEAAEANVKKKLADSHLDAVTDFHKWQELVRKLRAAGVESPSAPLPSSSMDSGAVPVQAPLQTPTVPTAPY
jgi:hypothetical protein